MGSIESCDDLVPLLFAHNTYKSYSEAWLTEGQWERMGRWLQTVSTYDAAASDADGIDDLDAWVCRLEEEGRFVACSSGTTGKPALLGATEADLDFSSLSNVSSFSWATGVAPGNDRRFSASAHAPTSLATSALERRSSARSRARLPSRISSRCR